MPRPVRYGFSVIPKNSDDGLRSTLFPISVPVTAATGEAQRQLRSYSPRLDKYAERLGYRII